MVDFLWCVVRFLPSTQVTSSNPLLERFDRWVQVKGAQNVSARRPFFCQPCGPFDRREFVHSHWLAFNKKPDKIWACAKNMVFPSIPWLSLYIYYIYIFIIKSSEYEILRNFT